MKKILGASLAVILAFAAVGCSSSKFKTTRARLKNNAEKALGASEASKKQKNAMEKDDTELTDFEILQKYIESFSGKIHSSYKKHKGQGRIVIK